MILSHNYEKKINKNTIMRQKSQNELLHQLQDKKSKFCDDAS